MNMQKLSPTGKEIDIDCMPNSHVIDFLESLRFLYLLAPIGLFFLLIVQFCLYGHVSSNLLNVIVCWSLASVILLLEWPSWTPRTLEEILASENSQQNLV